MKDNLFDILKVEIKRDTESYHMFDKLFEIGVTQVTERWHDQFVVELILEGDFKDEDIARAFYQHSPAMYKHVGEITVSVEDYGQTFTYGFTRK